MIIMIVDDDRLVRFAVKSMLRDILGESEDIFLEVANGRDMVTVCKEKEPDVAFVDIRMPYMNGVDAIEECKKYSGDTQYVIMSGYSDFEYAQKGIRLGVSDYLLKPVDCENLKDVMERIRQRIDERYQESNSRFQLQIMEAFNYFASMGTDEKLISMNKIHNYLAYFLYIKDSHDFQNIIMKKIKKLGDEVVSNKGHYAITNTADGTICVVFELPERRQDSVMSYMKKICLETNIKHPFFYYLRWVKSDTLQEICCESEKADRETYLLLDRQPGMIYDEKNLKRGEYETEFLAQIEKLIDVWKQADGIECKDIINKLWRTYKEQELNVNLKYLGEYCSAACGCPISHESFKLFFQSFVDYSEQMYIGFRAEESDMIEEIKKYIQKNYMYDISISQIAEQFGLSANYLSTIFKRKTGERFIDYLTRIRIEAAKKLLIQNASASVQDIALMTGYTSSRHFSTLFQKYTGKTPTVYRKLEL